MISSTFREWDSYDGDDESTMKTTTFQGSDSIVCAVVCDGNNMQHGDVMADYFMKYIAVCFLETVL